MYIQLLVSKALEINGKMIHFHPGDWAEVGKQSALSMVANGEAIIRNQKALSALLPKDCDIVLTSEPNDNGKLMSAIRSMGLSASLRLVGSTLFDHSHVLVADPKALIKPELIPVGFHLLETWQMAVPLASYDNLAADIGSETDRKATKEVIRDLRVPYYDTRIIFMRRCPETRLLINIWKDERSKVSKSDERLAFLRAMYKVKPVLCALPTVWTNGG